MLDTRTPLQYMEYRELYLPPAEALDDGEGAAEGLSGSHADGHGSMPRRHAMLDARLERIGSAQSHVLPASMSKSDGQDAKGKQSTENATTERDLNLWTDAPHETSRWPVKVNIDTAETSRRPSLPVPRTQSPPTPEMKIAGEITDLMLFQQSPRSEIKRTRSKAH